LRSDSSYTGVMATVEELFAQHLGFSLLASKAMDVLRDTSRVLVQRGLLPPFTPASQRGCASDRQVSWFRPHVADRRFILRP